MMERAYRYRLWAGMGALLVMVWCGIACVQPRTYCVRRSMIVPSPAPLMRPAQMAKGLVEGGFSSDTVLYVQPPKRLEGRNVGLYLPRAQFSGYLLFSPDPMFSIGGSWEVGMPQGVVPVSPSTIGPPDTPTGGGGLHFSLHFMASRKVTVDLSCDLWLYNTPSRIAYQECDSDGRNMGSWQFDYRHTPMLIVRTQAAVGIDLGWSHLTIGVGVRNQPHNTDFTIETQISPYRIDERIDFTAYPYAWVGWEIHLTKWAHMALQIYQPLNFDPVIYAPVIGLNVRLHSLFLTDIPRDYQEERTRNRWREYE